MARWRESVVTEYGEQLLAEVVNGECNIQFVKASIGCGIYSEEEMSEEFLKRQSGMRQVKNEYAISSVSQEKNVVTLKVLMGNASVKEGYPITELGLWARRLGSSDEPELYSIVLADVPDYFPDSSTPTTVKHAFQMIFASNDVKVCIAEDMGAYVLVEDFNESIEKLDKKKVNEEDIHDWARDPEKPTYNKEEIGLGNVDNTADKDKPLSTAMKEAIQEIYEQATAFAVTKIAELINGAPATADTLKELADLIADNKSVVDALDAAIGKKANQSELDTHMNNSTIHFTKSERDKLSGIAAAANNYTHPASAAGAKASGLYKIITDANGHVTGAAAVTKSDITNLGVPGTNTTYGTGTASVSGLTKLYTSTGTSTDGTMTRAAITDTLKWKSIGGSQGLISISLSSITSSYNDIIVEVLCGESESRYVYTWNIARSSLPASSQKGKRLISGYSTGGYSGYCEVLISTSYAQIVKAIVGNREYVGDGAILTIYYR